MSRLTAILKSKQKFPKPISNWDFGNASKIQEGATAVDVAGWGDSQVTNQRISGNLIINGTFDTDLSDWSVENVDASNTITWDSSEAAHIISDGTLLSRMRQQSLVVGSYNNITFDVTESTGTGLVTLRNGGTNLLPIPNQVGSYSVIAYIPSSTDLRFTAQGTPDINIKIDNVKVFELNPLTVAYDLTQTTAAAQPVFDTDHIVFDGSDYLEGMPTQSGDFTYITKLSTENSASSVILGHPLNAIQMLYINASGLVIYRSSLNIDRTSTGDINDGLNHIVALTRLGSLITIYVDSVSVLSVTDAGDFLVEWLGDRFGTDLGFDGKINNELIYPTALDATEVAAKTASLA